MTRSLRVRPECVQQIKFAVQDRGYPRQKDLAEALNLSLATVSNFLNGKSIDFLNFVEICDALGQDWQAIALIRETSSLLPGSPQEDARCETDPFAIASLSPDVESAIYIERPPIESLVGETLFKPGSLLRIKAPTLMGKTLLVARLLKQVSQHDYRMVYLNLH